ncbi:hypothetical protein [Mesoterricola silvestris]|uniref:Uncharacterized protein n=1 Tax=Mesoterricola silvestris TaxID=2927979 RepID=A0AA48H4P6_9BACT|nr:hypothetical protein [Mesoterricola silvestris]BDU71823.1 hypothetical protein METEAL_09970 [Mesoterricola silvestris]
MAPRSLPARRAPGILAALLLLGGAGLRAQETVEGLYGAPSPRMAECRRVAQADLERRLAGTEASRARLPFGVRSAGELQDAALGFGFEVFTLSARALRARGGVEAALESAGIYRFAVLAGGRTVGLLTVATVEGRPKVVEVGSGALAGILDSLGRLHLGDGTSRLRFVRVPELHQDFLEVARSGAAPVYERITPPGKAITGTELRNLLP